MYLRNILFLLYEREIKIITAEETRYSPQIVPPLCKCRKIFATRR